MSTNSQNEINPSTKTNVIKYISLSGKSRAETLVDRIQSANEQLNTILESSDVAQNKANIAQNKSEENKNNTQSSQPNKLLNDIITDNNKSVQVGLDDINNTIDNKENNENQQNNENQENNQGNNENKIEEKKEINLNNDIDVPFIRKTKLLLNELKKLKEKGGIKEEELNNEISDLPKRGMLEMSLSDFKIKKKCELLKKELEDKNTYIKKLENEIVNQRVLTNNLKKSESEYLLKISALEDELRVMKLKLLGYNTSEQFSNHNHELFNTDASNCGHIYGENLVQSMWIKDNKFNNLENDNKSFLNKNDGRMNWNSQSPGNMNRIIKNIRMNNNEMRIAQTENRYLENGEKNYFNNGRYDNYRINNNNNNGGNSNFQRVSEMILNTPNMPKVHKNFSNEFNRFRIGNNKKF